MLPEAACAGARTTSDVVLAVPAVDYDFSNNASRTSETVVLARAVCIEDLRELALAARVHARTIGGAFATISVRVMAVAPSRWQPNVDYVADAVLASVTVDASTPTKALLRAAALAPLPTHVQLQLVAVQGGTQVTLAARLSVDLSGKR